MQEATIKTHGVAKGDPGAAAIAVQIVNASGNALAETTEVIGNATSALAAFTAVARGLDMALQEFGSKTTDTTFTITTSNEEVKQQVNGESPITNPGVVPHFIEVHNLRVSHFPDLVVSHVPQAENKEVARMVNEALDGG